MSTAIELPGLSETQREIIELAREFARTKIEPFAAEWDRRAHFARDVIDELGRLGFLGMCAPEEYDGMGLDSDTYLLALEEIAAADASVAVSLSIHNAIPTTMLVRDRKSTRLNSSHDQISYAVFCLKKKKHTGTIFDPGPRQPARSV